MSEGWTGRRLAKAFHCGEEAASGSLHAYAFKMRAAAAIGGGDAVEVMRAGATAERRAVADRLARLGELCDDLLAEAEARLCTPLCAVDGLGGGGGDPEGKGTAEMGAGSAWKIWSSWRALSRRRVSWLNPLGGFSVRVQVWRLRSA